MGFAEFFSIELLGHLDFPDIIPIQEDSIPCDYG